MITNEQIDALERLEREATPGPWEYRNESGVPCIADADSCIYSGGVTLPDDIIVDLALDAHEASDAYKDVELACKARNALPALIAELRELRAYKQRVEYVKTCRNCDGCGRVRHQYSETEYEWGKCVMCEGLPNDND